VVDDVVTTGATLAGAAAALRQAGAREVEAAVLAAAPGALDGLAVAPSTSPRLRWVRSRDRPGAPLRGRRPDRPIGSGERARHGVERYFPSSMRQIV
jgi:hypothetical protein